MVLKNNQPNKYPINVVGNVMAEDVSWGWEALESSWRFCDMRNLGQAVPKVESDITWTAVVPVFTLHNDPYVHGDWETSWAYQQKSYLGVTWIVYVQGKAYMC